MKLVLLRSLALRPALAASIALAPAAFLLLAAGAPAARAEYSESILHTFDPNNTTTDDGHGPDTGLAQTSDGTLWGMTSAGGAKDEGVIYKYTVDGQYKVVHNFGDGSVANDGADGAWALTVGPDGNLYGTTLSGGAYGLGTVFKLTPGGKVTILHSFGGSAGDGNQPPSSVTFGSDGKLYGTTGYYGYNGDVASRADASVVPNEGVIYSLNTDGSDYVVQFRFGEYDPDYGIDPLGTLLPAPGSTLKFYGTANQGGDYSSQGTLFSFTPGATDGSGKVQALYEFGTTDGGPEFPQQGRLNIDAAGNFIGTSAYGGANNDGCVYEISADGKTITTLHSFDGADGEYPQGGLQFGSDGAYYGIAQGGGTHNTGVVFRVLPAASGGGFSVVYNFGDSGASDGDLPLAKPFEDSDGNLIGTTYLTGPYSGSTENGELYKLAAGLPNPVAIKSVTLSPATAIGGQTSVTATVTLNKPAGSAGAKIALYATVLNPGSGTPGSVLIPSSLNIPHGSYAITFPVIDYVVNAKTIVQIAAAYNNMESAANLTVNTVSGSPGLKSIALSPDGVQGGTQFDTSRVYLYGDATLDSTVTLTSSDPSVATVQPTATVETGYSSRLFTIKTNPVKSTKTVTITAQFGSVTESENLKVTP